MSEVQPQVLERSALKRDLGLWTGLLAGPIAWALHQQVMYSLVPRICAGLNRWVLHAVSLVCILMALAGTAVAWRLWQASGPTERGEFEGELHSRIQFMAMLGVTGSLFFAMIVFAQAIPTFILDPCQD